MENVRIYQKEGFGELRVIQIQNELWFVAADVCRILEHSNSRMAVERLDDDEKGVSSIYTPGGTQEMSIVSESGLYSLVLGSRKPEAKAFKRWITHDVIPSIRKTGGYVSNDDLFIQTYLPGLGDAEKEIFKTTLSALRNANDKIAMDAPKVRLADSITAGKGTILVSDLAKLLRQNGVIIGRDRLFEKLRSEGYLCTAAGQRNHPTQRSMELGLFEVSESVWRDSDGNEHNSFTTKVTGKGQQYFLSRFSRWGS